MSGKSTSTMPSHVSIPTSQSKSKSKPSNQTKPNQTIATPHRSPRSTAILPHSISSRCSSISGSSLLVDHQIHSLSGDGAAERPPKATSHLGTQRPTSTVSDRCPTSLIIEALGRIRSSWPCMSTTSKKVCSKLMDGQTVPVGNLRRSPKTRTPSSVTPTSTAPASHHGAVALLSSSVAP